MEYFSFSKITKLRQSTINSFFLKKKERIQDWYSMFVSFTKDKKSNDIQVLANREERLENYKGLIEQKFFTKTGKSKVIINKFDNKEELISALNKLDKKFVFLLDIIEEKKNKQIAKKAALSPQQIITEEKPISEIELKKIRKFSELHKLIKSNKVSLNDLKFQYFNTCLGENNYDSLVVKNKKDENDFVIFDGITDKWFMTRLAGYYEIKIEKIERIKTK